MTPAEIAEVDRLAIHSCRRYFRAAAQYGLDSDDLLQEARMGVIRGKQTFNPERGRAKWQSHALLCGEHAAINALQVAKRAGFRWVPRGTAPVKLSHQESLALVWRKLSVEPATVDDRLDSVRRAVAGLTDRVRRAVERMYVDGWDRRQVAAELGRCPVRASQIINDGIAAVRTSLGLAPLGSHNRSWSAEDDAALNRMLGVGIHRRLIAARLGRTPAAVAFRCKVLARRRRTNSLSLGA